MVTALKNFLNGIAFGVTQIVPGVSAGTVAIILGFYNELLESVNSFRENPGKHVKFLAAMLLGAAFGIVAFGSLINYLLTSFSFPTMLFFIGLIVGAIPHIRSRAMPSRRKLKPHEIVCIALPVLALVLIANVETSAPADPAQVINGMGAPFMLFLFIAGVLAAAALVIPGLSGSFVLLLLGVYHVLIYSVSSIRHLLADLANLRLMLDIIKVLLPFGIGVIAGGLTAARIVGRLFEKYCVIVYLIILGLMLGSVYALFMEPVVWQSGVDAAIIAVGAVTFTLGCAAAYLSGKKRF
ncbi:MAG: DUF368 domain-containing protein [Oscillospiraceae bacterium]|nr:DUF368 domain-containing protein [Oscillospiraceae bacterium]